jgi:hypothetical protein
MYGNRYNVAEIERENVDIRIDEYLHRFENVREQLASGARLERDWSETGSETGARLERDGSEPSSNSQAENLKSETKSVSLQQPHSDEARDQGRTFQ